VPGTVLLPLVFKALVMPTLLGLLLMSRLSMATPSNYRGLHCVACVWVHKFREIRSNAPQRVGIQRLSMRLF